MNSLMSATLCNHGVSKFPLPTSFNLKYNKNNNPKLLRFRKALQIHANATNEVDAQTGTVEEEPKQENLESESINESKSISGSLKPLDKDLKKVVQKTAATFAPRASTATKNPAVPELPCTLFSKFKAILMGMWSIWMFTIPSLRARDCSKNEKEALNYLFLIVPLINVIIPFFWKSFAVVWSADTVAFFAMYAWKLGWLQKTE
ncbi:hypothetical protein V6N12_044668 [Hibiscus sabdariffa]|uniref:Uncharacterized protein n=1 Tax=Hibiscus sabdariffa TaxID=183260 RepID=A0ABR2AY50_9ROSI